MGENRINYDVISIFEYLLAVKNLKEKTCRSIDEYEEVWWNKDFLNVDGCYLGGTGTDDSAWLEVHKQDIKSPPSIPTSLYKWVSDVKDPDNVPIPNAKVQIGVNEETDEIIYELFEEDHERVDEFNNWLNIKWKPWAKETSPKKKIEKLYMQLFEIHQRFKREGDEIEFAWGHGLLSWKTQNHKIKRHFLVTKLELLFNAKRGIFTLHPTSKGTELETDMLTNISIPNAARLQELESEISNIEFNVWNQDSLAPLLREIIHTISPTGSYIGDEERNLFSGINDPMVEYSPSLFLRKSSGRLWQKELTTIIQKLKEGYPVPKTITALTSYDESSKNHDDHGISQNNNEAIRLNSDSYEELLFPLPTNAEQKSIAKKLASNDGIVVQGPPGTGKSHTIANLICHLLAHGKRVLVTSEKERALSVLRDKIPEEVRNLCVSVLGGDSKSVKEIEDSIKNIAENLDTKQVDTLEKSIKSLAKDLDQTKRQIAKVNTFINQSADLENEEKTFSGKQFKPIDASKWLVQNNDKNYITDKIKTEINFPLSKDETDELFVLLGEILKSDKVMLYENRVSTNDIPDIGNFESHVQQFYQRNGIATETEKYLSDINYNGNPTFDIEQKIKECSLLLNKLKELKSDPWLYVLLEDVNRDPQEKERFINLFNDCKSRIDEISTFSSSLLEDEISLPGSKNLVLVKEDLIEVRKHFVKDKKANWMYRKFAGRKYTYIFEECKVNGLEPRNINDVDKLIKYIERNELTKKLILKWNRIFEEIDGPVFNKDDKRLIKNIQSELDKIKIIINWDQDILVLEPVVTELNVIAVNWIEEDFLNRLYHILSAIKAKKEFDEINEKHSNLIQLLEAAVTDIPHPLSDQLYKAATEKDVALWKDTYEELLRLEGLDSKFSKFKVLFSRLKEIAPNYAQTLWDVDSSGTALQAPKDLQQAWLYAQLNTWIKELKNKPQIEDLEAELQIAKKKESKLIQQLAAEKTWLSQVQRTTTEQKRSLFAWLKAIQRIGQGTGKYAGVYRKEAAKEMKVAKNAIPVWIMPINRVIENIELNENLFDVVIVDESSQSNLFSLSALIRAKKAVIVGDDNQISPEDVGTDIGELHALIERFLARIPNKLQFEMKTSLYDTVSRIFDSKIVLKEHFRCVPEIIQFSNDFMYGGKIDPLRLPLGDEIFEPPVVAVRVEDGYRREDTKKVINEPEAEAITEHIAKICRNSRYNGKSIGVISLQGHDQAKVIENMLRDAIGEEEFINRNIICGDSYSFQGDERDIIFLSMVAASNVNFRAMTERPAQQRFNVAASRARDQMFLFHSVDLNDLNPNCVRYHLLQYCKNPYRANMEFEDVKDILESPFEEDVFKLIAARGYRVVPQVKVGSVGKRIDMVIEGMRNRLAIECDGDKYHTPDKWEEDIERQRILERVGWTFWRVRGSQFYLDPNKAMESLWEKLNELGIEPHIETAY